MTFNPFIFATQCRRPLIFQTINYVRSNNASLKIKGLNIDIGIRKFEFIETTQFILS